MSSFEDGRGILSTASGEFPAAALEIRDRLGNLPLLLAGMVGSTRGWMEAPYVPCPASADDLGAHLTWVEPDSIAIVPGLSFMDRGRADVMRGEEVQLFGAVTSNMIPASCIVGHPGTHNKWVVMTDGKVVTFRTVMTGELFAMLRSGGMLADMLTGEVTLGEAFRDGVKRGLSESALTAELFSVRAGVLLGSMAPGTAQSYVSGLLIGADVGLGLGLAQGMPLTFMGDPDLTRLYVAAAEVAGQASREVEGEAAFLAGACALGRTL